MKRRYVLPAIALLTTSCATMDKSLELGASMGTLAGIGAMTAAGAATGKVSGDGVAIGAGIGAGLGLITAFLLHRSVEDDRRANEAAQTEMHFGDLPPSPFIVPRMPPKKGSK